jgi:hypothetical protein
LTSGSGVFLSSVPPPPPQPRHRCLGYHYC